MVLTRTDENELLTALHGGMAEDEPWGLFLRRLLARTEADLCRIAVRRVGGGAWQAAAQARDRSAPPGFAPPDPPCDRMRPGRVYAGGELGEEGGARHMRVGLAEGGDLCLSIFRAAEDFAARDAALLAGLAPHLLIALRMLHVLERERERAAMGEREMALLGGGWLLVDAQARLLDCDVGTAALVARGEIMGRAADGRLRLLLPEAEALLEAVIGGEGGARAGWLWIDPPMQMLVQPSPATGGHMLPAARWRIRTRILPRPGEMGVDPRILSDLFRLTPSEAAFAARMGAGAGIAQAAEALSLTIETARNYSKRIYGKTGVHGQADLMRLLSGSVRGGGALSP